MPAAEASHEASFPLPPSPPPGLASVLSSILRPRSHQAVSLFTRDPALSKHVGPWCWSLAHRPSPLPLPRHPRSPFFGVALRRRLRMPVWDLDSASGMCGEVMDRLGDHALSCCGGILRHNATRNGSREAPACCFLCVLPIREGPCLNMNRALKPPTLSLPPTVAAAPPMYGFLVAFPVSPRRGTFRFLLCCAPPLRRSLRSPRWLLRLTPASGFQDTPSQVACLGATFCPLPVLEACRGGWFPPPSARSLLGFPPSLVLPQDASLRIAQRESCTLHRENARAILRRSPEVVGGSSGLINNQVGVSGW